MTNEKIVETLKKYKLPVFYKKVPEEQLTDYNYFIYGETNLKRSNCRWYQTIQVILVYEYSFDKTFSDIDIVDELELIGLKLSGDIEYDNVSISKTNKSIEVVTYNFIRGYKG